MLVQQMTTSRKGCAESNWPLSEPGERGGVAIIGLFRVVSTTWVVARERLTKDGGTRGFGLVKFGGLFSQCLSLSQRPFQWPTACRVASAPDALAEYIDQP